MRVYNGLNCVVWAVEPPAACMEVPVTSMIGMVQDMPSFSVDSIVDSILKIDDDSDPSRDTKVQVLVDESVDPELIVAARDALRPTTDNMTVSVGSFFYDIARLDSDSDLLIVLANRSKWVGGTAAVAAAADVPCVVVAQDLAMVVDNAQATGFPLDYENIVSKEMLDQPRVPGGDALDEAVSACGDAAGRVFDVVTKTIPQTVTGSTITDETLELDAPKLGSRDVGYDEVFDALGDWVMDNCPEFCDAFADAFEFAKVPQVRKIAQRTAFQNALVSALPIVQGADFPVMTTNQIKMLVQISRSYGISPDRQTIPEALLVVLGGLASRELTRALCKKAPILSWFIKTGTGYIVTMAEGHVMNRYMQGGRVFPIQKIGKLQLNTDQQPTCKSVVAKVE